MRIQTALTVTLAAAAFALSFDALRALAAAGGISGPLATLFPLIIDGTAAGASLIVLTDTIGRRSSAWPWAVVTGFTLISLTGNLLHAHHDPSSWFVAALPPLALVTTFELLMRQLRAQLTAPPHATGRAVRAAGRPVPQLSLAKPIALTRTNQSGRSGSQADDAVNLIARAAAAGNPLTGRALASQLGCSDSYARRLIRQHRR
jgi:hypothetical protein